MKIFMKLDPRERIFYHQFVIKLTISYHKLSGVPVDKYVLISSF